MRRFPKNPLHGYAGREFLRGKGSLKFLAKAETEAEAETEARKSEKFKPLRDTAFFSLKADSNEAAERQAFIAHQRAINGEARPRSITEKLFDGLPDGITYKGDTVRKVGRKLEKQAKHAKRKADIDERFNQIVADLKSIRSLPSTPEEFAASKKLINALEKRINQLQAEVGGGDDEDEPEEYTIKSITRLVQKTVDHLEAEGYGDDDPDDEDPDDCGNDEEDEPEEAVFKLDTLFDRYVPENHFKKSSRKRDSEHLSESEAEEVKEFFTYANGGFSIPERGRR